MVTNLRKAPGELQLIILSLLQKEFPLSVTDICARLNYKYAYTTILTTVSRMHAKKELERQKEGRQYVYYLRKKNSNPSLLERIKHRLFQGKTAAMIHYLIDTSEELSPEEVLEIEKILQRYKK